ncbi:MAG: TIGR02147 family protein [Proteobacteria bacterium]|nr:MAG: TIGR02147 family protein [Pseudomonadota bacterium]
MFDLTQVKPSEYLDYKLYFQALYLECKGRDETYSYQKFAAALGFEATTVMHQIIKGYRPLTLKACSQILKYLKLDKFESRFLLQLVEYNNSKNLTARESAFARLKELKRELVSDELDLNLLDYFSKWYHPIIWELIGTEGFKADAEWIVGRILPRISLDEVQESLELLQSIGLIRPENESFVQTQNRVSTGHRIKGMALVSYHQNMLDHAKNALTQVSGKRRDVSSLTLSVTEEGAARLRAMIHAFQIQLLDEAERCEKSDQVYQVNIQLFPFTE